MELKKVPKSSKKFYCEKCDYSTSRESQYMRHINTRKHKMELTGIKKSSKNFFCKICNKLYETQSGLWKHENKCIKSKDDDNEYNNYNSMNKKELINMVIENKELIVKTHKDMSNLIPNTGTTINNTTINNTTINSNNYNINIFLNENCKDALNIMEFVNLLKIKLKDIDICGNLQDTKGISNVFIEGLKNLDISKRPLHCIDLKEETIYIKDNDVWELDDENIKIKKAIDNFKKEDIKNIPLILEENKIGVTDNINVVNNIVTTYDNDINNIVKEIAKETII